MSGSSWKWRLRIRATKPFKLGKLCLRIYTYYAPLWHHQLREAKMKLLESVPANLLWRLNVVKVIRIVIFLCSVIYVSYTLGYLEAEKVANALYGQVWASHMDFPVVINKARVIIILCLIVSIFGIGVKRVIGVMASSTAYVGIIIVYVWWYKLSQDFLSGVELPNFTSGIAHIGPFKDASWLDITVLIFATSSFVLHFLILFKMRKTTEHRVV